MLRARGRWAGADQEVGVIGQEGPGVHRDGPRLGQGGQAGDEVGAVGVVPEDGAPLPALHHHVVQGVWGIEARLAGHGTTLHFRGAHVKLLPHQRPLLQRKPD